MTAHADDTYVSFDASASSDPDGDALSFSWDYGDGSQTGFNSQSTTSHTYATGGEYTATVTVKDGRGGSSTASVTFAAVPYAQEGLSTLSVNTLGWAYYQIYLMPSTSTPLTPGVLEVSTQPCSRCTPPAEELTLYLGDGFLPSPAHYTCRSDNAGAVEACVGSSAGSRWYIAIHNDADFGVVDMTVNEGMWTSL